MSVSKFPVHTTDLHCIHTQYIILYNYETGDFMNRLQFNFIITMAMTIGAKFSTNKYYYYNLK